MHLSLVLVSGPIVLCLESLDTWTLTLTCSSSCVHGNGACIIGYLGSIYAYFVLAGLLLFNELRPGLSLRVHAWIDACSLYIFIIHGCINKYRNHYVSICIEPHTDPLCHPLMWSYSHFSPTLHLATLWTLNLHPPSAFFGLGQTCHPTLSSSFYLSPS